MFVNWEKNNIPFLVCFSLDEVVHAEIMTGNMRKVRTKFAQLKIFFPPVRGLRSLLRLVIFVNLIIISYSILHSK